MIISWNVTNKCNMHCKHCYRDSGEVKNKELTTKEALKLIKEIYKAGFKMMIFSGGEPLMREDIYEVISYASSLGIRTVLGSNGTLITRSVASKLKDAGIKCAGISLDSLDPKKHNAFRKNNNAWSGALFGMKNCRDVGLPFQIHTTVMKWNKDEILNITDLAVSMGAKAHYQFFLVPTGRGEEIETQVLDSEEYNDIIQKLMKKQKNCSITIKPTCAPQFIKIGKDMDLQMRFKRGCLAGISYCIIAPNGDVQPCAYLDKPVGNVKDNPFDEIWNNNSTLKTLRSYNYGGNCGKCKNVDICGGCRARAAYYNNGNYMAGEKNCKSFEAL
jgi:AdoMet-dependent heme synthase